MITDKCIIDKQTDLLIKVARGIITWNESIDWMNCLLNELN